MRSLWRRARRRLARNRVARFGARLRVLARWRHHAARHPALALEYAREGREVKHFKYELENEPELRAFVISSTGAPGERVRELFRELREDAELRDWLSEELGSHPGRNPEPRYGRRLAFYSLMRLHRPAVAVETGVHDGMSSAVLLRALERNAEEGYPGVLHAFDRDPEAGWLVPDQLRDNLVFHEGEVRETLAPALAGLEVGLSLHCAVWQGDLVELATVVGHAAERIVMISSIGNESDALRELCDTLGAPYRSFFEQPRHWLPGRRIDLAVIDRLQVALELGPLVEERPAPRAGP